MREVLPLTTACDCDHSLGTGRLSFRPLITPLAIVATKILDAFDRAHVLGAFECRWIGAAQLAHAALHLTDGLIFMVRHPLLKLAFDITDMFRAFAQKDGTH